MPPVLPSFRNLDDYRKVYRDERTWLPAMRLISQRHGLDPATLRQAPPGTHVVFWVEDELLIKLFAPLWPSDDFVERLVLRALAWQSGMTVPSIVTEGVLEGWPYLVLTRLPGTPLDAIWGNLNVEEKNTLVTDLGRWMAALHRAPTSGLDLLQVDWAAFLEQQIRSCVARNAIAGLSLAWQDQLTAFLADLPPLYTPGFQPVLLHADLTLEHLLCQQTPSGWRLSGVIDFGDAMLGCPEYDFAAPGLFLHHAPALQRQLLLAYGYPVEALNTDLSLCLQAFTLLHRYGQIPLWLNMLGDPPPGNLTELQEALWGGIID